MFGPPIGTSEAGFGIRHAPAELTVPVGHAGPGLLRYGQLPVEPAGQLAEVAFVRVPKSCAPTFMPCGQPSFVFCRLLART